MNELSLFSGAGGGVLGSKLLGWKTVGYVEYNDYCQRVIKQRITDGIFDEAPIFGDIRAFNNCGYAESYTGLVDIITAGFPCQPFSVAGKQLGEQDERNMWPETIRTIRTVRPRFALLENVPGILSSGYFGTILGDLYRSGYNARWCVLGTSDIGGDCIRKRVWIFAASASFRWPKMVYSNKAISYSKIQRSQTNNDNTCSCESQRVSKLEKICNESAISGSLDGVAHRMDRLKAIGNGQVPIVAATAWEILSGE